MSKEPTNKHSQAHRIWRREEAKHKMAPSPVVEEIVPDAEAEQEIIFEPDGEINESDR